MNRTLALLIAPFVIIAGCASDDSEAATASSGAFEYRVQSWSKPIDITTCGEWRTEVSGHDQLAAAAAFLTSLRNDGDGGAGIAPHDLIVEFSTDLTRDCTNGLFTASAKMVDVAARSYLAAHSTYAP